MIDLQKLNIQDMAEDKPKGSEEKNCCNCKHSKYNYIDELDHCDNEHSDYYGVEVYYDDVCPCWEEKVC